MSDTPSYENIQQGASFNNFKAAGGDSSTFNIGNNIQNNYLRQESEFVELTNLEEFKSPLFPSPRSVDKHLASLYNSRLLVLGGSHEDKSELALHLAVKLREKIQSDIPVYEWIRSSSNPHSLVVEIRGGRTEEAEKDKETIKCFFLPALQPQDVNHNLYQVQKAADKGKNYIIATTDVPLDKWTIDKKARELFYWELNEEKIYNPNDLADILMQKLDNNSIRDEIELELRQLVAENLKTVASIGRCAQLLAVETLRRETIYDAVRSAGDGKGSLEKWFRTLEPRDQLLALGLSLFDGLFDDQFFAALEKVVKNVWQRRDSSLRALDYCDLENLGNYFDFSEIKAYGRKLNGFKFVKPEDYATEIEINRIDIRRAKERRLLFEVAWESHRRQLLTALPVLVQMVKDSAVQKPSSWELYGGQTRCNQLRSAIGETLGALGLVSTSATSAVQDALFQLASNPAIEVQDVAASAIARWYRYGNDKELFGTLQNFYSIAIEKKDNAEKTEQWQDCIGATVALTVGYAAGYDRSDQLSKELCDWLKELSESQSTRVQAYFGYLTLFYVVPLHLTQLRDMLKEITQKHSDLNEAIAKSLARAYQYRSQEVLDTLESWYKQHPPSKHVSQENITRRERVLAAVALTYGEIQYDEEISAIRSEAFSKLSRIFIEEKHHFVREAATTAICSCISQHFEQQHFEQIEVWLQDLVPNVTEYECSKIIETLTEVYLKQRESLKGGDGFIEVNNHRYRAWIDATKRPETDVEKAMFRWVKDDTKAIAQQVAIRALLNFAVLEQQEKSLLAKQKQEPDRRTQKQLYTILYTPITIGQLQEYFYFARLVSWLVTLRERDKPYQLALRNVLPEALKQHNLRRETMSFVLGKWRRATDNKIKNISDLLKNGLWLAENFWLLVLVVLGGGILLTFTGMALVNVIQSIPVTTSQPTPDSSVVPTPEPTSNSTFTQQEAVNVINNYLQAKEKIFAPPYDRQLVANFTTGKYYEYITRPGGAIDELQQNNQYYQYGSRQTEPLGYFSWTGNQAQIDLRITEQSFLYENASFKEEKSYSESYRFTLEQENGVWKIADRVKLGSQDGE